MSTHYHFPNRYRLGDTIALYDLAAFVRSHTDPTVTFSVDPGTATDLPDLELFATEKGLFVPPREDATVFDDVNLWLWNDYLRSIDFRVTYEPDPLPERYDVILAPLLDVEYAFGRSMHLRFVEELIVRLAATYRVGVLIAPDMTLPDRVSLTDAVFTAPGGDNRDHGAGFVFASLRDCFRLAASTSVWIGGDTGLTHFAGHVPTCKVVALHDRANTERHTETEFDHQAGSRSEIRRRIIDLTGEKRFESYRPRYYSGPNRNDGARQILFDRHGCDGVTADAVVSAVGGFMREGE